MNRDPLDDDVEAAMDRAQPAIDSVLRRYRARRTLDRDDAEEIKSEVQVTLLTRLRQTGAAGIDAFEAYAVGVTRNLIKMLFRQRRRRRDEALAPMLEDELLADLRPLGQTAAEQRYDLERIWRKIEAMPSQHRAAILLGMHSSDGSDSAGLLVFLDVTSMDALAAAIGIVELDDSLWDELPLDDARIAQRLGVTPRKVISLRRSVRRRLTAMFKR
jgi:RNA polymerase sigma factor (sigma-70 family)